MTYHRSAVAANHSVAGLPAVPPIDNRRPRTSLHELGMPPTPAQLRVMAEYARHGDRQAAADCLGENLTYVRTHLGDLYSRLGATSALQAALLLGWLEVPGEHP